MNTTETAQQAEPQASSCPTLRLLYSGSGGTTRQPGHALREGDLAIGREPPGGHGICLPGDRRASRHHATFHCGPSGKTLDVSDAGSKNGTFVNGRRVQRSPLNDGDIVRIGDSFVLVRFQPARPSDAHIPSLSGTAPAMRALRSRIAQVAPSTATVLLLGESGTGKELAARAVHEGSGRSGPLVAINCSAIPESLAESQLFGHVAGAFTGAQKAHPGYFRAAHGGTLFLDEIGELSPTLQPKLLRALEEHAVTPVGSTAPIACDARVVAATHRHLEQAVAEERFRGDLYARLAEVPLRLPPLRERREDVLSLLEGALGNPTPLTPQLVSALLLHSWPYNVRELLKIAAQLRITGAGAPVLDLDLVSDRLTSPSRNSPKEPDADDGEAQDELEPSTRAPAPTRDELAALLREHRGVVSRIARAVGRSRRQVDRWIEELGLDVKSYR